MSQERVSANQFYSSTWDTTRSIRLLGPIYSVIGRNVLNCALRYLISLDNIMNKDIQPRDTIGRNNANDNHSSVLPLLQELLCRTITL